MDVVPWKSFGYEVDEIELAPVDRHIIYPRHNHSTMPVQDVTTTKKSRNILQKKSFDVKIVVHIWNYLLRNWVCTQMLPEHHATVQ